MMYMDPDYPFPVSLHLHPDVKHFNSQNWNKQKIQRLIDQTSAQTFDEYLSNEDDLDPLYGFFDENDFDDIKKTAKNLVDQVEEKGCITVSYDYDDLIECLAVILLAMVLKNYGFKLTVRYL